MKLFALKFLTALGAMSLAATSAVAAEAYLVDSADLYAGPDVEYPQITTLPAGVPVTVYGCTDGWEWCDVQTDSDRGWVSGEYLEYEYQSQRVLLPSYGARIGIPIVAFSVGVYWQEHYRSRPWYGKRDEWSHRTFEHRPAPRPRMPAQQTRPEPVRHAANPAVNRQPPPDRKDANDRSQSSRTSPQVPHRAATEHAAPKPQNNPPAPVARSAGSPEHATPTPGKTQRSAPTSKPKPAPKEKARDKEADKKDDGHL